MTDHTDIRYALADDLDRMGLWPDDDDENECEGHESLDGAHMGESVYCDGTCVVRRP